MRTALVSVSLLAMAACTRSDTPEQAAAPPATVEAPSAPSAPEPTSDTVMTAEDPGGFTEEGFVFHTRPGSKHVVRLPSPGTDTWKASSSGGPTVKQTGLRKETTPEGKAALVFEYEMLQSGNVSIEFQRLEDGEVEGKRTIIFMVH
jgi:hypothetical protein